MKHIKHTHSVYIFLLFVTILFNSCESRVELTPEGYAHWYSMNKELFVASKQIGNLDYSFAYRPTELLVANWIQREENDSVKAEIIKNVNKSELKFAFKISNPTTKQEILKQGIASMKEYNDRVQYYSFESYKDFKLYTGNDTLYCTGAHFERTYGLSPDVTLNLSFIASGNDEDGIPDNSDITLSYNDRIFNNGLIKVVLPKKNIKKYPKLKL